MRRALSLLLVGVVVVITAIACAGPGLRSVSADQQPRVFNMPIDKPVCAGVTADPVEQATLLTPGLTTVTGAVSSPTHRGVLWVHGASDGAHLSAVSAVGADLGGVDVPGIEVVDVEGIAAAPCPDLAGPCLYLADTGDRALSRAGLTVYAVPEPDVEIDKPLKEKTEATHVWSYPLTAPDGPIDVGAMVVLPNAAAMVFYERTASGARILRNPAPWFADTPTTLELTGTLDLPGDAADEETVPLGADIHPSGTRLVLRTRANAYLVKLDVDTGVSAFHLGLDDAVPLFSERALPPGAAVTFDDEGTGLLFLSSPADGGPPGLQHAICGSP